MSKQTNVCPHAPPSSTTACHRLVKSKKFHQFLLETWPILRSLNTTANNRFYDIFLEIATEFINCEFVTKNNRSKKHWWKFICDRSVTCCDRLSVGRKFLRLNLRSEKSVTKTFRPNLWTKNSVASIFPTDFVIEIFGQKKISTKFVTENFGRKNIPTKFWQTFQS